MSKDLLREVASASMRRKAMCRRRCFRASAPAVFFCENNVSANGVFGTNRAMDLGIDINKEFAPFIHTSADAVLRPVHNIWVHGT